MAVIRKRNQTPGLSFLISHISAIAFGEFPKQACYDSARHTGMGRWLSQRAPSVTNVKTLRYGGARLCRTRSSQNQTSCVVSSRNYEDISQKKDGKQRGKIIAITTSFFTKNQTSTFLSYKMSGVGGEFFFVISFENTVVKVFVTRASLNGGTRLPRLIENEIWDF